MSPRAAWRLESLGFQEVYDYSAGKADWLAWGLPREGRAASTPTVAELAHRDVSTCGLQDTVGEARARAHTAGWDACVVTNEHGVVLGLLRRKELDSDTTMLVEEVMMVGPTTYRPGTRASEAADRMRERHVTEILVTTPDGVLVGMFRREDAE